MQAARDIEGSFENADDLLWQAAAERLPQHGSIRVCRSGRIGPLVEFAMARRHFPDAYKAISFEPRFVAMVDQALDQHVITGGGVRDVAGVFPLALHDPASEATTLWDQWAKHAENAAANHHLPRQLVGGLLGALGELQDNVYVHSGRIETGLVAYAVSDGAFEFVVADAGIGVLASLKQNPEFAAIQNSGQAMQAAISDGASRFGRDAGRGYGIGKLFRALAHEQGDLRFRSGDHALTLSGDNLSLTGNLEVAEKAALPGFVVSVLCRASHPPNSRQQP